jgi:N-acetylglucosamine-6-phosphate deacetylase
MIALINARVADYPRLQKVIVDERGIIARIEAMDRSAPEEKTIDLEGDRLSLGGVDLQINGALGLPFPDLEETDLDRLDRIGAYLWERGVDGYLPTLVTTSVEKFRKALLALDRFMERQEREKKRAAKVLGVHLEGPFLNRKKKGAHPEKYLLPLSVEAIEEIFGDYLHRVKIITLAPELDGDARAVRFLSERGITVSLGHSEAGDREAREAFENGARMLTHAFNAMPPLHHREAGLLARALLNPEVYCGLIADGQHVNPIVMRVLLRASDPGTSVFLVSDALAPVGLGDGSYPWDDRQIQVTGGTARLADGTLAGTTLPLLQGVVNLVRWGVCDVPTAIAMGTETPRKAIGLPGFAAGRAATLLRWHAGEELTWQRIDLGEHLPF